MKSVNFNPKPNFVDLPDELQIAIIEKAGFQLEYGEVSKKFYRFIMDSSNQKIIIESIATVFKKDSKDLVDLAKHFYSSQAPSDLHILDRMLIQVGKGLSLHYEVDRVALQTLVAQRICNNCKNPVKLERIFYEAVGSGYWRTLLFLFQNDSERIILQECIEKAHKERWFVPDEGGQIALQTLVAQRIRKNGKNAAKLERIFYQAVESDNWYTLLFLFQNDSERIILQECIQKALEEGWLAGVDRVALQTLIAQWICKNGKNSAEFQRIFYQAAEKGNLPTLLFLLQNGRKGAILQEWVEKALELAADSGKQNACKFLLQHGGEIGVEAIGDAFKSAGVHGYKGICELLQRGREIPAEWIDLPLQVALINNNKDMCEFLLLQKEIIIPEEWIKTAFRRAAENGYRDLCEVFLKSKREIPIQGIKQAFEGAAQFGRKDVCQLLLQTRRDILVDTMEYAFKIAAKNGHTDVCEFLLLQSEIKILEEWIQEALVSAIRNRHKDICNLLLQRKRNGRY